MMFKFIKEKSSAWLRKEDGIAALEAALIFPVLMTLLLGVYDLGNGILANQKAIRASQVIADLLARGSSVDDAQIAEAIEAGRLALDPMDTSSFGVDIVSVSFDGDAQASVAWQVTENMLPAADPLSDVTTLADANSGVLMVGVVYDYEPLFGNFVIDTIEMYEVAFSRGRSGGFVERL